MCVTPKSTKYTIRRGMLAMPGMKNLCRQRISKRSSPMPKIAMDWIVRMAERYEANYLSI